MASRSGQGDAHPEVTASSDIERRQQEIHDLLEEMRRAGVEGTIELPQVVVCGDQSSAKSSVLEAISGIPLPTKDVLCTRFPLELSMRKSAVHSFSVGIKPDTTKPQAVQDRLRGWRPPERFTANADLNKIPEIIRLAGVFMGLEAGVGEDESQVATEVDSEDSFAYLTPEPTAGGSTFSRNTLQIQLRGPGVPTLTLVDLPGLFHSEGGQQTLDDAADIKAMVLDYMSKPRTIILAIVQATVEPAMQIVITLARQCDPNGERTLGIVTKPDVLADAPNLRNMYIQVLRNKHTPLGLGYHVVRTRKPSERGMSTQMFTQVEDALFSHLPWTQLPPQLIGIPNLRVQLDRIVLNQVTVLARPLAAEVDELLRRRRQELLELSSSVDKPMTLQEIRDRCDTFRDLMTMALDGDYRHPFFRGPNARDRGVTYLRRAIEESANGFSTRIERYGHSYHITEDDARPEEQLPEITLSIKHGEWSPHSPVLMSRSDYLAVIVGKLQENHTVPGQLDMDTFWQLFHEQTRPWLPLIQGLLDEVYEKVVRCVELVLAEVLGPNVDKRVYQHVVGPAVLETAKNLQRKAREDTKDLRYRSSIKSFAIGVTDQIAAARRREWARVLTHHLPSSAERLTAGLRRAPLLGPGPDKQTTVEEIAEQLSSLLPIEQSTSAEIFACLSRYYETRLKTIQNEYDVYHLSLWLSGLPRLFSREVVDKLPPEKLSALTEGEECVSGEVQDLETQIDRLEQVSLKLSSLQLAPVPVTTQGSSSDPIDLTPSKRHTATGRAETPRRSKRRHYS